MRTQYAGRPMAATGHTGTTPDRVAELVAEVGPVEGLYRLEDAERVAETLANEKAEQGHHATAAGFRRAAHSLRQQQFELVARFA